MDRTRARLTAALALIALALAACSNALPMPLFTSHEGEEGVVVPDMPPVARVEVVGKPANEREVWMDGEWQWRGDGWRWRAGRWEVPPEHSAWAPATTVRTEEGKLVHFEGRWRRMR